MSPSTELRENREFAFEVKFLVTRPRAAAIHEWARVHLAADPNASGESGDSYLISSLYFDTADRDVFHQRGSFGRSKYRIRRYGDSEVVFLERKLKTGGVVSKRRSSVDAAELPLMAGGGSGRGWAGYWFQRRLRARALEPQCQISYRRTARVAMTSCGPVRLTMDDQIRTTATAGLGFASTNAGAVILPERIILELKFRSHLPVLFKRLIEEFGLNPEAVSKYRLAAAALGVASGVGSRPHATTPLLCLIS